jgi:hypothetical protein
LEVGNLHNLNFDQLVNYNPQFLGITVEVKIQFSDISLSFPAKIDTRAESCIFERAFGEQLGIDIESGETQIFNTVTGSFLTFGHFVTIFVENLQFDTYVYFANDFSFKRSVLGRFGFLDRVVIAIDDYDGKLYLSPKRYDE